MKIKKILIIEDCADCDNYDWNSDKDWCDKCSKKRVNRYGESIPKWCPLENYKEVK